jgi:hypothetical protein
MKDIVHPCRKVVCFEKQGKKKIGSEVKNKYVLVPMCTILKHFIEV